jgi:hypothetical protein
LIRKEDVVAVAAELSVTRIVTAAEIEAVGDPEIRPVFILRESPVGRVPVAIEN